MKKLWICLLLLLAGCTNAPKETIVPEEEVAYFDAYQEIEEEEILDWKSLVELVPDIVKYSFRKENSDLVAIITIQSVDGGSNYDEINQKYTLPFTVGKLKVEKVIEGDKNLEGSTLSFVRSGGIIEIEEHKKYLEQEGEKWDLDEEKTCLKHMIDGDVLPEAGTSYLAFLKEDSGLREDAYDICFFDFGLQEVKGEDLHELETLQVNTGNKGWLSLPEYIDE